MFEINLKKNEIVILLIYVRINFQCLSLKKIQLILMMIASGMNVHLHANPVKLIIIYSGGNYI